MIPVDISKADKQTLRIKWENGDESFFPMVFLRRNCPCATCREAQAKQSVAANPFKILKPGEVLQTEVAINEAQVVGRYALCFVWNDGHREGIYTFDFLRELAEADECREVQRKLNSIADRSLTVIGQQ